MRAVDAVAESPSVFDLVEMTVKSTARRPGSGSGNVTCSLGPSAAERQSFRHAALGGHAKQPVDVGEHDAVVAPCANRAGRGVGKPDHRPSGHRDLAQPVLCPGNPLAVGRKEREEADVGCVEHIHVKPVERADGEALGREVGDAGAVGRRRRRGGFRRPRRAAARSGRHAPRSGRRARASPVPRAASASSRPAMREEQGRGERGRPAEAAAPVLAARDGKRRPDPPDRRRRAPAVASAMSWRRWRGSLTSVRRSSRRIEGGVPAGSCREVGLALDHPRNHVRGSAAPAKARLPASIS